MSSSIAAMRPESIRVHRRLAIPLAEIQLAHVLLERARGQHAQKTEREWRRRSTWEASSTPHPLRKSAACGQSSGPVLQAVAQDERSQWRNRELAPERLAAAIREPFATSAAGGRPRRPRPRRSAG